MVQGLAFLSKKSWHVKNLANQEKVWMAEQQQEREAEKTKELARQIQQERERDELERISGVSKSSKDRGIDWMYQGSKEARAIQQEQQQQESLEYLLGKKFTGGGGGGDFNVGEQTNADSKQQQAGLQAVVSNAAANVATSDAHSSKEVAHTNYAAVPQQEKPTAEYGESTTTPTVQEANEAFRRRIEDPMYAVAQSQYRREQDYQKRKALYQRVLGPPQQGEEHDERKEKKRNKKHSKKLKKQKREHDRDRKRKRRHRHYESEEDSSSSLSEREHSSSKKAKKKKKSSKRHYSRDRSKYGSNSEEDDYSSDDSTKRKKRWKRRRYSPVSTASDSDHGHRDNSGDYNSKSRIGKEPASIESRSERHSVKKTSNNNNDKQDDAKPIKYGLQGKSSSDPSLFDKNDLGPSRDLLREKQNERRRQRQERLNTNGGRSHMTRQEREAAIQEMQRFAQETDRPGPSIYHGNDEEDSKLPARGLKRHEQEMALYRENQPSQYHRRHGGHRLDSKWAQR